MINMERKDHRVEVEVMDLNSNNSLDLAEVVASVISTSVTLKIYLDRLLVARILSPTSLTTTMNFSVVDLEVWVLWEQDNNNRRENKIEVLITEK